MEEEIQIQQNCIMKENLNCEGYLYTWGKNTAGCLGNKKLDVYENVPYRIQINQKFIQVSSGGFFVAAISNKNELYTWGDTKNGRTGHPSQEQLSFPKIIPNLHNIILVSCGNWHCLALNSNKQVFVTGHNKYGACGLPEMDELNGFVENEPASKLNIEYMSAGDGFSLFLNTQKQLYSCGFRLRHGNKEDSHQFSLKQIQSLKDVRIRSMHAGFSHAACVSEDQGEVYTWGQGDFLQLGHGTSQPCKTPKKIANLQGIVQVSCSRGEKNCHTMATNAQGEVYTWGSGYKGKLGHQGQWTHKDPADEPLPKKIQALKVPVQKSIAGGIHSALLTADGKAMTFGCGSDGRLGHPEESKYVYLYREPLPRVIEGPFANNYVIDLTSSYYFMAAICSK